MFLDDHRFHTLFQCDFYYLHIFERKYAITKQKWIDWTHCESLHDTALDAALAKLIDKGMKDIMCMKYDWSEEVIAQFYSTVLFEKAHNTIMHFMIEGQKYKVTYTQFRDILGFDKDDTAKSRPRVHALRKVPDHDLAHMFYEGTKVENYGSTQHLLAYYKHLHSLIRSTVAPKSGDLSHLQIITKSLLNFFLEHGQKFSVFDFIWEEIVGCAYNSLKTRTHAPYLMKMIEEVTNKNYVKEITHECYRVKKITHRQPKIFTKPKLPPSTSPLIDDEEVPHTPHFDDPFMFYEDMQNKYAEEMDEGNDDDVINDEDNIHTTDEDMDED
ncbi:hypothetical protein BS78_09G090900 [Paspalum vaginatum]|nr:hypothetical protein BS78_09G090900 [Paspalum vaginatum]